MISNHPAPSGPGQAVSPEPHRQFPSIPLPGLSSWVQAACHCGFEIESAFKEVGVDFDQSHAVGPLVSTGTFLRALEACVRRAPAHHFPLTLGDAFVFDRFQQLEEFLLTSATLREAVEVFPWLRVFQLPWMTISLEESASQAALVVTLEPELARDPGSHYLVDLVLATVRKFSRTILGDALNSFSPSLIAVQLQRPRPNNAVLFQDHFLCPVQFGHLRNALVFPRALLDVSLAGGRPDRHGEARQAIKHELERSPSRFVISELVRHVLETHPQLIKGGLEDVALVLGLHCRTLQRRLQAEGARFAELQAQAKYTRARQLLAKRAMGLDLISAELGFSDRRAFTFAFKRWAGHSPSAYRRQVFQTNSVIT
ncbi:MAG: AraC family transcriptional regulator ligand-binding domain-containing protein [Pseudomonadota bacterium]